MRFSTRTGLGRVFASEAVVTFVPVLVITAVTTDNKVPRAAAAVAIGAALAAAILISGPISGAGVNPARAIGPMILTGPFTGWWVPDRTGHRRRASRHHLPTALAQGQHNPSHQLSHRGPGTDLSYSRLLRHQINWPATRKADNHRAVAPPSRPRTSRAKEGNTWHPNKCLRLWSAATSSPATSHSRPSWTASSAISQPDIGQLFSKLAASTSYEEFASLVRQAQGSVGLMRFLQLDLDAALALSGRQRWGNTA